MTLQYQTSYPSSGFLQFPGRLSDVPYPIWGREQQSRYPGASEVFIVDSSDPKTRTLLTLLARNIQTTSSPNSFDYLHDICRQGRLVVACARVDQATRVIGVGILPEGDLNSASISVLQMRHSRGTAGQKKLADVFGEFKQGLLARISHSSR